MTSRDTSAEEKPSEVEADVASQLGLDWSTDAVSVATFLSLPPDEIAAYTVLLVDTGLELPTRSDLDTGTSEGEKALILLAGRVPVVQLSVRSTDSIGIPNTRDVINAPNSRDERVAVLVTDEGLEHPIISGIQGEVPVVDARSIEQARVVLGLVAAMVIVACLLYSDALAAYDLAMEELDSELMRDGGEGNDPHLPYVLRSALEYERGRFVTWNAAFQWVALLAVVLVVLTSCIQLFWLLSESPRTPSFINPGLLAAGLSWIWLALVVMLAGRWFFARRHWYRYDRIYRWEAPVPTDEPREGADSQTDDKDKDRVGICFSGGGIRSAAFALGALQKIQKSDLWERVGYVAAVSGGAYAAAAHAIARSRGNGLIAFEFNSREIKRLRNRSNYIAPGLFGKGRLVSEWSVGFTVNLIYVAGLLFLVAFGAAMIVRSGLLLPQLATINNPSETLPPYVAWVPVAPVAAYAIVSGVVLGILFGWVRAFEWPGPAVVRASRRVSALIRKVLQLDSEPGPERLRAERIVVARFREIIVYVVLSLVLVMVAIPSALWLADQLRGLLLNNPALATTAGTVGLVGWLGATVWSIVSKHPTKVAAVLAGLMVPVALVGGFIAFGWFIVGLEWQVRVVMFVIVLVLVLATGSVPTARASMHPFYRTRLAWAFADDRSGEASVRSAADAVYKLGGRLGSLRAKGPQLLICAAGNVGPTPVTPPGRGALPYTFSQRVSGLDDEGSGRPWWSSTEDLDLALRYDPTRPDRTMTVMGAVAVSGAAVSPSMGKLTRPLFRALLALLNIRLGVWLPNPLIKHAWFERSPSEPGSKARVAKPFTRPARHGRYFVFEALGIHPATGDYMYVTDGAHYDDLGLLKLLRERCKVVICFDASGEDMDEFGTISRAMRLAEADLDTTIDLDIEKVWPTTSVSGAGDKKHAKEEETDERTKPKKSKASSSLEAPAAFVKGEIRYPDTEWRGTIYYCKATIDEGSPWSIKGYRQKDRTFPSTSTGQQLFNDERFEAYRELGRHIASEVLKNSIDQPKASWRAAGSD
ncbi:MAG: patatin-like phospholipase family protein [Acidimicrobiia bacterium]